MTPTQLKEAAQVMMTASEGKQVQYRETASCQWVDIKHPTWDWYRWQFRTKPEPREWWMRKHLGYNEPCSSCGLFTTLAEAKRAAADNQQTIEIIHLREFIE